MCLCLAWVFLGDILIRPFGRKYKIQKQPPEVFCKKNVFFKCCRIHRKTPEACNFIKKETLAQVFSCKFCNIFKNTFFTEQLRTTASEDIEKFLHFIFYICTFLQVFMKCFDRFNRINLIKWTYVYRLQ